LHSEAALSRARFALYLALGPDAQPASVGSIEAANEVVARFGVIDV
jgi:hypothetical protein